MTRAGAACLTAVLAFALYRATLLPGLDFGDTPSFQVMAGEPSITPRDGYPLFFALGDMVLAVTGGDRAHALNLASAIEGSVATAVVVLAAAELSGSLAAGLAAAALFGGCYTFWSQSVIAEVYPLHILFVALSLLLLLKWEAAPTLSGLARFFAIYAIGFGTHLAMILLAPAYAVCVISTLGPRRALSTRVAGLAAGCAALGSAQYLWNLRALWLAPLPPEGWSDGLHTFWNDVTKADWRSTMVIGVPRNMTGERLRMYGFDLGQQFGWLGPVVALAGIWFLARRSPRRLATVLIAYVATVAFGLSYNVGDTHVFLLPSHLMLALLYAVGLTAIAELITRVARWRLAWPSAAVIVAVVSCTFSAVRIYRDFPALDRSDDHRPSELLETLTGDLDDRESIFVSDLNWQIGNGLNYFSRYVRHNLATINVTEILDHGTQLVRDNAAVSRRVVATEGAALRLKATDPKVSLTVEPARQSGRQATLLDTVRSEPDNIRYVLTVLRPTRDMSLDRNELGEAIRTLTGNTLQELDQKAVDGEYGVIAGITGHSPSFVLTSTRPFSRRISLGGVPVTVRMESWMAFDTIRRMGFGHVIVNRQHTLIVERGVSLVFFDGNGSPLRTAYAGNIFEPRPRYRLSALPL